MPGLHLLLSHNSRAYPPAPSTRSLNNTTSVLDTDYSKEDETVNTRVLLATLPIATGILLTLLVGCICVFILAYVGRRSECSRRNNGRIKAKLRGRSSVPPTVLRLSIAAAMKERGMASSRSSLSIISEQLLVIDYDLIDRAGKTEEEYDREIELLLRRMMTRVRRTSAPAVMAEDVRL